VTGPFGHILTFANDTSGPVIQMTVPDGGVYTYAYSSTSNKWAAPLRSALTVTAPLCVAGGGGRDEGRYGQISAAGGASNKGPDLIQRKPCVKWSLTYVKHCFTVMALRGG
jgi:uncharacterized protein RhaS with RHS repeats